MTEQRAEVAAVAGARAALEEDHRRLHGLVDGVRAAGDLPGLVAALVALGEELGRHFQLEEKPGGLYDSLGACVPGQRERLGRLVDDHYRLLADARQLLARARGPLDTPLDAIREQAEALARHLGEHERREDELARAVIGEDAVAS